MNIHCAVKIAAVATMIALATFAIRREHKHPALVTRVTEMVVMEAQAAPIMIVKPHKVEHVVKPPVVKAGLVDRAKTAISDALPKREPTSRTSATDGSGAKWTFPYSCRTVKWAASTFSKSTLETMRKKAGERLPTAAEESQIADCIAGKFQ